MVPIAPSRASDVKMRAATGKTRNEWFALLDAENAATWSHAEIADWLHREHGVGQWWTQGVTVAYEQARGIRIPGQQSDGTFAAGSSKTVEGELRATLNRTIALLSDHYGLAPSAVSHETEHPTARWKLGDGTEVLATLSRGPLGSVGRCRVALTRLRLAPEQLDAETQELAGILSRLEG
ncbi:DUF4287 domain-containing protein [Salinibacterium sp. dk2585]|uniref:DUF4287 domain-containing protein n=1 Tax=unclassified Salinibacterium TaxID=2632331 RepID=UPI0011C24B16|nr:MULTISPECIES: DUF4287 domain-containing protein [unclassified Salinibacterium]QEE61974.1 DUF4287 domain-containing protein [Salinibacterium sp. dk2585]TXK54471.1 DUF4287 domain-containing protein [Salinibacterium sp. dk5596]